MSGCLLVCVCEEEKNKEGVYEFCMRSCSVSPCVHGGGSHKECCSPVSVIRGLHKHGERGERKRETGREGGVFKEQEARHRTRTVFLSLASTHAPKGTVRSSQHRRTLIALTKSQFHTSVRVHVHLAPSFLKE